MPSNTTYNPPSVDSFVKTALLFNAQGVSATVTAGSTQNIDLTLTDDSLLTGVNVISGNGNFGDYVNLEVIDTSGAFTGVPGTLINQFVTNWYLAPEAQDEFKLSYPAKLLTGMTIRIIYVSTGTVNPFLATNYELHKILF